MTAAAGQILIFDDSPALASCLQQQLQHCGLEACCIVDTEELLRRAAEAALVFIELYLQQDNGFRLSRYLRKCYPDCAVVLLSGTGRLTDLPWGLGAGALAVLPRPVSSDQLEQVLRKAGVLPGSAA